MRHKRYENLVGRHALPRRYGGPTLNEKWPFYVDPLPRDCFRLMAATRVWSDGLPPKPICSDPSGVARLRFTKWCSTSNERGWFDDSPEPLVASKCWLLQVLR